MNRSSAAWHTNPGFFVFKKGGGPMLDMGPYYVTQLVNLLGPVARVTAVASNELPVREVVTGPLKGSVIRIEVPATINGVMEFVGGANIAITTSWEVQKHSRSPFELYGADALRYYAMREVRFGQDGEVSPEGFESRYTSDLANEYGNLASRTVAMIGRYRDGVVPEVEPPAELKALFDGLDERVCACLDDTQPTDALEEIWQRVRGLNGYVQEQQPWQLAKDDAQAERLDSVLLGLAEGLRVVSLLLWPFVPAAADRLLDALGVEDRSVQAARFGSVAGGATLGELGQLFPKVEPAAAA